MKRIFPAILLALTTVSMTGCLGEKDTPDYSEWRTINEKYISDAEIEKLPDGTPAYSKITPVWAPSVFCLMKWHNDRNLTLSNLMPRDNSTVDVKYCLRNIEGDVLDSSYSNTAYGDSIYRIRPNKTVVGFWTALTSMHVGDSVTVVVPWEAGYGSAASGTIPAYTTLIFDIKLVNIKGFEKPY